jgi:hypothetical protein
VLKGEPCFKLALALSAVYVRSLELSDNLNAFPKTDAMLGREKTRQKLGWQKIILRPQSKLISGDSLKSTQLKEGK